MPAWDLHFRYAEQFPGIQPQDVPKRVTLRTWRRWKLREMAWASRHAHKRANQPGVKWAELPPEVIEAKQWADEDQDEEDEST